MQSVQFNSFCCSNCGYEETTSENAITWVCPKCTAIEICRELGRNSHIQPVAAVKYDADKPDMTLITYEMLEDAAKVLMFGEAKYSRFNYRNPSPNFERRLIAAAMRHMTKHTSGEEIDKESGLPHLAHALATLMMVFDRRPHVKEGE